MGVRSKINKLGNSMVHFLLKTLYRREEISLGFVPDIEEGNFRTKLRSFKQGHSKLCFLLKLQLPCLSIGPYSEIQTMVAFALGLWDPSLNEQTYKICKTLEESLLFFFFFNHFWGFWGGCFCFFEKHPVTVCESKVIQRDGSWYFISLKYSLSLTCVF